MFLLIWLIGVVGLQVDAAHPYYIATKSSESFIRRHGPMPVSNQRECALACSCASGLVSSDECSVFERSLPNVNCLAYSYDFNSRQCALLGGPSPKMCTVPVTIYELGDVTTNPKCGPTTLDHLLICDSEGYKCPAGHLPYLVREFSSKQYRHGGMLAFFNGTDWILSTVYGLTSSPRSVVQNITCQPAPSHTHDACNTAGNMPWLMDALMVKNTFECFPGFEWDYGYTTKTVKISSAPVCNEGGWSVGTKVLTEPIRSIACIRIAT